MLLCHSRVTACLQPPKDPEQVHGHHLQASYRGRRVRHTAYICLKGHPRQSQTFDRKADAIRWAKQHETAVQTGRHLVSQEASK